MRSLGAAPAITDLLAGQTSLLVLAFTGHPWQVEMHFYYFAVLAMLALFIPWVLASGGDGLVSAIELVRLMRALDLGDERVNVGRGRLHD